MCGAECAAQRPVPYPQTGLNLLRQEHHSLLEVPGRNLLLAIAAIEVGTYLDVGERFHRIVVVEIDLEIPAHAVVADVEVLVEDIRGGIVADAESQIDHGPQRVALRRRTYVKIEGRELALRDQVFEHQRIA